jgi:hypothetical protein
MKIANSILALLFFIFAAVQYNDPDPWLWIVAYIFVAVQFILQIFQKLPRPLLLISIILFAILGMTFIPDFIDWIEKGAPSIASEMKATEPHIELVREFGGLLICLAGLFFLLFQQKKK